MLRETLDRYRNEADIYHVCVPFMVTTCTSMFQDYWRPWNREARHLVREMPKGRMTGEKFPFWNADQMGLRLSRRGFGNGSRAQGRTACFLVGIRTGEA